MQHLLRRSIATSFGLISIIKRMESNLSWGTPQALLGTTDFWKGLIMSIGIKTSKIATMKNNNVNLWVLVHVAYFGFFSLLRSFYSLKNRLWIIYDLWAFWCRSKRFTIPLPYQQCNSLLLLRPPLCPLLSALDPKINSPSTLWSGGPCIHVVADDLIFIWDCSIFPKSQRADPLLLAFKVGKVACRYSPKHKNTVLVLGLSFCFRSGRLELSALDCSLLVRAHMLQVIFYSQGLWTGKAISRSLFQLYGMVGVV